MKTKVNVLSLVASLSRLFAGCLLLGLVSSVQGEEILESAREIPLVRSTDVLVVGGSSAGVTAAVAAKKAGAKVFLVAPRPYLGDDIAGTLRLALEGNERPETKLAQEIWIDNEVDLPFSYKADAPSVAPHRDSESKLSDGKVEDVVSGSVQFDVPKVKVNLVLEGGVRFVEAVELEACLPSCEATAEFVEVLRLAECVQVGEYGVAFHLARVADLQVAGIGEHGLDLGRYLLR